MCSHRLDAPHLVSKGLVCDAIGMRWTWLCVVCVAVVCLGCSDDDSNVILDDTDSAVGSADGSATMDGSTAEDAAQPEDASSPEDAAMPEDGGSGIDSSVEMDAALPDASDGDAAVDAAADDAGADDGSAGDDAGAGDAGTCDGTDDCPGTAASCNGDTLTTISYTCVGGACVPETTREDCGGETSMCNDDNDGILTSIGFCDADEGQCGRRTSQELCGSMCESETGPFVQQRCINGFAGPLCVGEAMSCGPPSNTCTGGMLEQAQPTCDDDDGCGFEVQVSNCPAPASECMNSPLRHVTYAPACADDTSCNPDGMASVNACFNRRPECREDVYTTFSATCTPDGGCDTEIAGETDCSERNDVDCEGTLLITTTCSCVADIRGGCACVAELEDCTQPQCVLNGRASRRCDSCDPDAGNCSSCSVELCQGSGCNPATGECRPVIQPPG